MYRTQQINSLSFGKKCILICKLNNPNIIMNILVHTPAFLVFWDNRKCFYYRIEADY
jgi:hypothetical protein